MNNNLKKYFWEYNFTEEELTELLSGKRKKVGHLEKEDLYARIITMTKWYEALDIIGKDKLEVILSEKVLKKIYPESLKKKFIIARNILYN